MAKSQNGEKQKIEKREIRKKKKVPLGNPKRHILVKFHDDTCNGVGEIGRDGRQGDLITPASDN